MRNIFFLIIAGLFVFTTNLFAQPFCPPFNTMETITVSGTALVIDNGNYPSYYLDEDADGTADYSLHFGPYWYSPDNDAVRPQNGDAITITGGFTNSWMGYGSMIVVYEINDVFWRDPFNYDGNYGGGYFGNCWGMVGWNQQEVSLTGVVIVDSLYYYPHYYLDTNADEMPDYYLNFGPYWYEPGNGVVRPNAGDEVTIVGGMNESGNGYWMDMVIVWELNGEFWRDPFEYGGGHYGGGGCHGPHGGGGPGGGWPGGGGCHGGGWHGGSGSWWNLNEINLTGITMIDSVYANPHYYIDTNNDNQPDYRLNFGPYWYEPGNGVTRPQPGDEITISGGLVDYNNNDWLNMIIVWEINGMFWQNSNTYGWGGCQIYQNGGTAYCPTDPMDWAQFPQGSMGGMGGCGWSQMYVEFLEQEMWELPNPQENMFGGYHFMMMSMGGMWGGGDNLMENGYIQFDESIPLNLHYTDEQLAQYGLTENDITLYRWNANSENWVEVSNAQVNTTTNTVTTSSNTTYAYYALAGTYDVLDNDNESDIDGLTTFARLYQNYPNPFNPSTQISFQLAEATNANLSVFDISGRQVKTLADGPMESGEYVAKWDGTTNSGGLAASGKYFYILSIDGRQKLTRVMTLLK